MGENVDRYIIGLFSGLVSSAITSSVAFMVGYSARKLTKINERKKLLEDTLNELLDYKVEVERFFETTQEIHGIESPTRDDIELMFKLHVMESPPFVPRLILKCRRMEFDQLAELIEKLLNERSDVMSEYKRWLVDMVSGGSVSSSALTEAVSRSHLTSLRIISEIDDPLDALRNELHIIDRQLRSEVRRDAS